MYMYICTYLHINKYIYTIMVVMLSRSPFPSAPPISQLVGRKAYVATVAGTKHLEAETKTVITPTNGTLVAYIFISKSQVSAL